MAKIPRSNRQNAADGESAPEEKPRKQTVRRKRRILKTSEVIARDIIHDIAVAGLKEGDALLPEAEMLQQYGVGRASMREALRLLEVNGLIKIRAGAGGGPTVGVAEAENLAQMLTLYFGLAGGTYEQLSRVMLILYPLIAQLAASRKLTKIEREMLMASVDSTCGATDYGRVRTENLKDFHSLLSELSRNPVWALLSDAVGLIFADHVIATVDSSKFHDASDRDHQEIADCVLAGDEEGAAAAMLRHTEDMIKFYRKQNQSIFSQLIEWR